MLIQCDPVGAFIALMAKRNDAPGIIPGFALHMCADFGRIGAIFRTAGSDLLFGDLLPMLEPGAATLACSCGISMYNFYFHRDGNLWDCGEEWNEQLGLEGRTNKKQEHVSEITTFLEPTWMSNTISDTNIIPLTLLRAHPLLILIDDESKQIERLRICDT